MLKREISEKLKLWRTQKNKKALCIIGARQIGKTTIIREFAKQEYENFIEGISVKSNNDRIIYYNKCMN